MRKQSILVVVSLVIGFSGGVCKAMPTEWLVADGGNGHFYEVVYDHDIFWADAMDVAISAGGYLATITSQEEEDFVWTVIDDAALSWSVGPWLGGFQPDGSPEPDGN